MIVRAKENAFKKKLKDKLTMKTHTAVATVVFT